MTRVPLAVVATVALAFAVTTACDRQLDSAANAGGDETASAVRVASASDALPATTAGSAKPGIPTACDCRRTSGNNTADERWRQQVLQLAERAVKHHEAHEAAVERELAAIRQSVDALNKTMERASRK